jgi:hypothetical protein
MQWPQGYNSKLVYSLRVDILALYHKDDSRSTSKHVFTADWTITLQISFNALVFLHGYIQADITLFTMKKVFTKALSLPTNTTIITVINGLFGVIIP